MAIRAHEQKLAEKLVLLNDRSTGLSFRFQYFYAN